MDYQAILDLLRHDRVAVATRCMYAQDILINVADLCRHVEFAKAVVGLAQRGGFEAARLLIDRVSWTPSLAPAEADVPSRLSGLIFDHALVLASHPQKGERARVIDLFALMVALPHADLPRHDRLLKLFRAYLASAEYFQTEVIERNGVRTLDEAMRLPPATEIKRCIGTTMPFSLLADLLVVAALSDGYPHLASEMLKATCRLAEWPITACLGSLVEVVMADVLTGLFLSPADRRDFTDTARIWLRNAVCGEPEDDEEYPIDDD